MYILYNIISADPKGYTASIKEDAMALGNTLGGQKMLQNSVNVKMNIMLHN